MTEWIGQQLGNYRLLKLLGQGGFADVYLGEHQYLNTKAAIKVLQARLTNEDSANFQNEARTIASLVHPNIVRVLEFGLQSTTPYLVMDYAPNGTLRQRLPKGVPLPPGHILPYVKQMASALMYAHERKLVHRDVKPENMLLGQNNEALLSDFGIATASQSSRHDGTGQIVGTASYMAPEQIQGKPVTASDQYALAVVVYEWLSGDRPFLGTFTEVASQHMFAPPPPLRQKVPSLPPSFEEIVMIALAKDPQQRFDTIQAFARAFEQACQMDTPTYLSPISSAKTVPQIEPTVLVDPAPPIFTPPPDYGHTPAPRPVTNYGQMPPPNVPTEPAKQGISRRTFALGMAGMAGLMVAGGAFVWWETSHHSPAQGAIATPTTAPTSVPKRVKHEPTPVQSPAAQQTALSQPSTFPIGYMYTVYRDHTNEVTCITWSPDGTLVATGSEDETVQVWNAMTGGTLRTYKAHQAALWAVAWQPGHGSQQIASGGSDNKVRVWDANTGATSRVYSGHTKAIYTVAWSPDGSLIASGGDDNTVQVWSPKTGLPIQIYRGHSQAVRVVSWSPDGTKIASCSDDGSVQVWYVESGNMLYYPFVPSSSVAMDSVAWSSKDGSYIVCGDHAGVARVLNSSNGTLLQEYYGHSARIWSVDWSPDNTKIASSGFDGTVQIWNPLTGDRLFPSIVPGSRGVGDTVWQALWSPNGKLIASASLDGTAQVWQAV
jgi:eukaryotic-like serine/threonine-protein kinase